MAKLELKHQLGSYQDSTVNHISQYLDTNGDGTGTKDSGGVNHALAAEIYYLQPPVGTVYFIGRMIVSMEDTAGMSATDYGNITSGLTNGVIVRVSDSSGVKFNLTDSDFPVKANAEWANYCYDADVKTWSTGAEIFVSRWTFTKSGPYIVLNGDKEEKIEVVLNDDFSGLDSHKFLVQGYSY